MHENRVIAQIVLELIDVILNSEYYQIDNNWDDPEDTKGDLSLLRSAIASKLEEWDKEDSV